jgi:hypothetical protein
MRSNAAGLYYTKAGPINLRKRGRPCSRKKANGPARRSLLCEEAVSFSLSTFTLDIDGKPTLVLRAKWQADADEICRAWVQAHWDELTREGPYGTELPPAVRLRMARATEKAAYETNAHSALLFYESPFSGDSSKRRQRPRGPQHPKVALDGWTNPTIGSLLPTSRKNCAFPATLGQKPMGPPTWA